MSAAARGGTARWAWAVSSAIALMTGVVLLFSLVKSPAPAPEPPAARPAIEFNRPESGSVLKDRATLLDPTPLFLPTDWNAAQKDIAWPEPGAAFQSYRIKPKFSFAETDLKLGLPAPVVAPAKPAEALTLDAPGALALGFGRAEADIEPLPRRGAFVNIVAARTGRPALSAQAMMQVEKLAADAHPPGSQAWQPVAFLAAVDAAGLFGPLVIVEPRSGVEEVDNYFKDFLERTVRLGERLPPGFYQISVGP
jgi:hypothetical protein